MNYKTDGCIPLYRFTLHLKSAKNLSDNTIEHYFRDIRLFTRYVLQMKLDPYAQEVTLLDISSCDEAFFRSIKTTDVNEFFQWLTTEKSASEKTRARRLASLKAFYKYLAMAAPDFPDPVANVPTPKIKKSLPIYLNEQEVNDLLKNFSSQNYFRDYAIFMVILSGGLRVSEVAALNLSDFQEESLRVQGKGGKERIVFLSQAAKDALEEYILHRREVLQKAQEENPQHQHTDALFLSQTYKQRMAIITLQKMIQRSIDAAGYGGRKLSAHKLRHSAATHLLKEGVNLRVIQEILGHESLNTTQLYTHVESEDLRQAALQSKLGQLSD